MRKRIDEHLTPYFSGRRMAGITPVDITKFIAHRQAQGIVRKGVRLLDVSNAEINRELQTLKRCFGLAIEQGTL